MCAARRLSEAERKKEIMDSAAKVIMDKGFEKATMEEIIAGTTLSKGGVYHYYGSVIEIFKDIMISGIEYRNKIIKEHMSVENKFISNAFMAKEMLDKIIDDNPYMPLYVEFLIAKKRNAELQELMIELQEQTKESFKMIFEDTPNWVVDANMFQIVTDFMNAMILGSNVLEARECFKKNRQLLEQMLTFMFENSSLQIKSQG